MQKLIIPTFMNITAKVASRMIPDSLATQPIFLCVDDTMVAKAGTRFENVSKHFDHAAHNGSNYLNGHCFSKILCFAYLYGRMTRMKHIPLFLYSFRWNIETSYYEQKTFWSLCSYMVRSCKGIEMLEIFRLAYSCSNQSLYRELRSFIAILGMFGSGNNHFRISVSNLKP